MTSPEKSSRLRVKLASCSASALKRRTKGAKRSVGGARNSIRQVPCREPCSTTAVRDVWDLTTLGMHQANYDTVKAHTTPCTGHEVPVIKVEF